MISVKRAGATIRQSLDKLEKNMSKLDETLIDNKIQATSAEEERIIFELQKQLWAEIEDMKKRKKLADAFISIQRRKSKKALRRRGSVLGKISSIRRFSLA